MPVLLDPSNPYGAPPDPNDVVSVTPHDVDPAYSMVEYVDGRKETLPTSEAQALPQAPPEAPVATVGAGNPTFPGNVPFAGEPGPQATDPALLSVGAPGPVDLVGNVQSAANGPGAGFQDLGVTMAPGDGPGHLPAAQVDPGAAVLPPADPSAPVDPNKTTVTTNETVANPAALMANTLGTADNQAGALDAQERGRQAAAKAENQSLLDSQTAQARQAHDDLVKAEIHTQAAQHVVDTIEATPIETDFFKDAPGRQVAGWVALALSGFLQGSTQGANPALNQMMQAMQGAQDRFIANQRESKNSKLALRTKALGDAKVAEASIRMQLAKVYDDHAKTQAKQLGLAQLPPAVSATGAQMRVGAAKDAQTVGMHVEQVTQREFEARKATPEYEGDRELRALGLASPGAKTPAEAHNLAMDPKGDNLGGMVQGAKRLERISSELDTIAKRHGGQLPNQNTVSWSSVGLAGAAGRMGSESAKDQIRAHQLIEEAKLAFKQTINIKSVDSENEGKNFNAMMDTGETSTTLQALHDKAAETNQRAVLTASGYTRNPQAYLKFIERTASSNPGVGDAGAPPTPKRTTGYREPQAATVDTGSNTGGGPATPPLPPTQSPSASAPGTPTAPDSEDTPVKLQTLQALKTAAQSAGLDGDSLTKIVRFESGGKADAKNSSGATGLIQWMPDVFKGMTKPEGYENVRHEDLKDLTAEEQIPLVIQYFKDKGLKPGADVGEMYLAVAAPSAVNKPDATVVYKKDSPAWVQNPAWRPADGGDITAGSIRARARRF